MTRVLITGASGLLGINLALTAAEHYEVIGVIHDQALHEQGFAVIHADLLQPGKIPRVLDEAHPDWVINCAALANLDDCERQPELAQGLNAEFPGRLATDAAKRGLRFLQVSTDAVFDGIKGDYDEEDSPAPANVYGRTKRLSELAVKAAHPHVLIIRPNFFGWSITGTRSLAEFFYNNLAMKKSVHGYRDRIFCPLLVTDLARIMLELLEKNGRGIYHVASSDPMSKYDFGVAIAKRFGLDASLIQLSGSQDTVAPRALNLSLRTSRVAKSIGQRTPTVGEGIERLYEQFQSGYRARLRSMAFQPVLAKG